MDWTGSGAWLARIVLAGLLIAACAADTVERRIPNPVVALGLVAAFLWHGVAPAGSGGVFGAADAGGLGLWSSAAGAVAAFCAFLVLHWFRIVGAGDVKLMGMLGAWFGLHAVPSLLLYVLLAGGLVAVVRLVAVVAPGAVMANLRRILRPGAGAANGGARARFDPGRDTADRLPYAWALALGAAGLAYRQYVG